MQQQAKQRHRARDRGEYYLAVFFKEHQAQNGKAFRFWSNVNQDKRGATINKFKRMVTVTWKDKVSWAAIYQASNDTKLHEFKSDYDEWEEARV